MANTKTVSQNTSNLIGEFHQESIQRSDVCCQNSHANHCTGGSKYQSVSITVFHGSNLINLCGFLSRIVKKPSCIIYLGGYQLRSIEPVVQCGNESKYSVNKKINNCFIFPLHGENLIHLEIVQDSDIIGCATIPLPTENSEVQCFIGDIPIKHKEKQTGTVHVEIIMSTECIRAPAVQYYNPLVHTFAESSYKNTDITRTNFSNTTSIESNRHNNFKIIDQEMISHKNTEAEKQDLERRVAIGNSMIINSRGSSKTETSDMPHNNFVELVSENKLSKNVNANSNQYQTTYTHSVQKPSCDTHATLANKKFTCRNHSNNSSETYVTPKLSPLTSNLNSTTTHKKCCKCSECSNRHMCNRCSSGKKYPSCKTCNKSLICKSCLVCSKCHRFLFAQNYCCHETCSLSSGNVSTTQESYRFRERGTNLQSTTSSSSYGSSVLQSFKSHGSVLSSKNPLILNKPFGLVAFTIHRIECVDPSRRLYCLVRHDGKELKMDSVKANCKGICYPECTMLFPFTDKKSLRILLVRDNKIGEGSATAKGTFDLSNLTVDFKDLSISQGYGVFYQTIPLIGIEDRKSTIDLICSIQVLPHDVTKLPQSFRNNSAILTAVSGKLSNLN